MVTFASQQDWLSGVTGLLWRVEEEEVTLPAAIPDT